MRTITDDYPSALDPIHEFIDETIPEVFADVRFVQFVSVFVETFDCLGRCN